MKLMNLILLQSTMDIGLELVLSPRNIYLISYATGNEDIMFNASITDQYVQIKLSVVYRRDIKENILAFFLKTYKN